MAQSKPVPHTLTTIIRNKEGERKTIGPYTFESKAEAERQKRAMRETTKELGGETLAAFIDKA